MNELSGILIATLGLLSCNNHEQTAQKKAAMDTLATTSSIATEDPIKEFHKLNDFLKKYEDKSQIFKVSSSIQTKITGKKGTVIDIDSDNLETINGQLLGKDIQIELKELTNQSELLRANAQTISNGKPLVSGGAYFISMTSAGNELKIKKGKSLKVQFPKITDKDMLFFYGQHDSLGQMNWQESKEVVKLEEQEIVNSNTLQKRDRRRIPSHIELMKKTGTVISKEEYDSLVVDESLKGEKQISKEARTKYIKLYSAIDLSSLGWFNFDWYPVSLMTPVIVKFSPHDSINYASVFLVFKNANSVLHSSFFSIEGISHIEGFKYVPIGYKARLFAYTLKNDNIYTYSSDITIEPNQTIIPQLRLTSEEEFKKLLN